MQKAKRNPWRGNKHYGYKNFYETYKYFANRDGKTIIDRDIYKQILDDIGIILMDYIINHAYVWRVPAINMQLGMTKYKCTPRWEMKDGKKVLRGIPDWKETKKLWSEDVDAKINKKVVYYENPDTGGYTFRISLSPTKFTIPIFNIFSYKKMRKHRYMMRDMIRSGVDLDRIEEKVSTFNIPRKYGQRQDSIDQEGDRESIP